MRKHDLTSKKTTTKTTTMTMTKTMINTFREHLQIKEQYFRLLNFETFDQSDDLTNKNITTKTNTLIMTKVPSLTINSLL